MNKNFIQNCGKVPLQQRDFLCNRGYLFFLASTLGDIFGVVPNHDKHDTCLID